MKRRQILLIFTATIMILVFLYGRRAHSAWQDEWEQTVAAANKEGRVNVYTSGSFGLVLAKEFQKRYPQISVVTVVGRGGATAQRILAEYRARRPVADVSIQGTNTNYRVLYRANLLRPIKPTFILPEVLDESRWWRGKHHYLDPGREYVFFFVGEPQSGGIFYNTSIINPADFTFLWDFLNPKLRGKIEVRDVRTSGPGSEPMIFFYYNPKLGPEFIRRLFGEMGITLFTNLRQGVDWLGNGKFPICFFCARRDIARAIQQGLPINTFGTMKEGAGISARSGTLAFLKEPPHPNAAKVFINWILSREGQTALTNDPVDPPDSLRIDIPKDNVRPKSRRMPGADYLMIHELGDIKPVRKAVQEALSKAQNQ